jgi:hypothetical protein
LKPAGGLKQPVAEKPYSIPIQQPLKPAGGLKQPVAEKWDAAFDTAAEV